MRIISIVTLVQVLEGAVFILGDYLSETCSNDTLLLAAVVILPAVIPIAYLMLQKKIHYGSIPTWVNTLTVLFVWVTETIMFSVLVGSSSLIPQSEDGWENLLNGIEYAVFPLFNIIAFVGILLLWNLILFVYRKIS